MGSVDAFLSNVQGQIGKPYVWGADSPQTGFDCSGLVFWAAQASGAPIGARTSQQMARSLPRVDSPRAGDLVIFNTDEVNGHVGVCLNDGCTTMIDAPHTGAQVRVESTTGFGTISGFYRIPGLTFNGPAVDQVANPLLTQTGIPGGGVLNDLTGGVGGDVAGAIVSQITGVIGDLPADMLKLFFGQDMTAGQLLIRGIEIVAGMTMLSLGITLLVVGVFRGASSGGAVDQSQDMYRTVVRQVRGVQREEARRAQAARGEQRRAQADVNAQKKQDQHVRGVQRRAAAEQRKLEVLTARNRREAGEA